MDQAEAMEVITSVLREPYVSQLTIPTAARGIAPPSLKPSITDSGTSMMRGPTAGCRAPPLKPPNATRMASAEKSEPLGSLEGRSRPSCSELGARSQGLTVPVAERLSTSTSARAMSTLAACGALNESFVQQWVQETLQPTVSAQPPTQSSWVPHRRPSDQREHQSRSLAEATLQADAKRRKSAYLWPSMRKGVSDLQATRQVQDSIARDQFDRAEALRASQHTLLTKFNACSLDEWPCEDTIGIIGIESDRPATVVIKGDGKLFDEDGAPFVWPWVSNTEHLTEELPFCAPQCGASHTSTRPLRAKHRLDDMINMGLDASSADGQRGRKQTGVKAWFSFCEDVMGVPANRPLDPTTTTLWEKLEDEWLAMRFVCALVQERGISPTSAGQYFSCVQGWHGREHGIKLAGGLKLERLPQMLKGLKRVIGEVPKELRRAVAPQALRAAMDLVLDPKVPAHANMRAALATALQGLLRSAEYTNKRGRADKYTLMRSDVHELSPERMIMMMHPCKNMHHLGGKTCPLVVGGGGEHVDAVAEMLNLFAVDPVSAEAAKTTPLFRDPSTNTPLRYDTINALIKDLMQRVGESAEGFSTHSLRIGGATALFARGATETIIRTMGRWSSDLHRLYVRACFEQCCAWTRKAGSATVSEVANRDFTEVDDY